MVKDIGLVKQTGMHKRERSISTFHHASLLTDAKDLQTPLRQGDDLPFTLIVLAFAIAFDVLLRDAFDHIDNLFALADQPDQRLVLRLEQLQQGPDGDVLERRVAAGQEAREVAVDAAVGLRPVLDEDGVVAHCEHVSRRDANNRIEAETNLWTTDFPRRRPSCPAPRLTPNPSTV